MIRLPEKFIQRMSQTLSGDLEDFLASYDKPPVRGGRANLLKTSPEELKSLLTYKIERSKILEEGFVLNESPDGIGNDPYHIAGLFYIQEPSAMAPIAVAEINPGMKVLDICAAPGGKSGGIAARMHGEGLLVANEIVPSRAKILGFTLERLGVTNAAVTCAHPDALCEALPEYFDRVIVDAPCSGEGMFRKDEGAIAEWSEEHVISCAQRQRAILKSAYKALRPGGKLIYSTCTFSREENEDNVNWLASEFPDMEIELTQRLYPHICQGEGHFVARLKKVSTDSEPFPNTRMDDQKQKRRGQHDRKSGNGENGALYQPVSRAQISSCANILEQCFTTPLDDSIRQRLFWLGDTIRLCPPGIDPLQYPFPLRVGFAAVCRVSSLANSKSNAANSHTRTRGYTNKNRMQSSRSHEIDLIPCHAAFMAHPAALCLTHDDTRLSSFLQGMEIPCSPKLSGYVAVCCDGVVTGFGKAVNGRLKNKYPKGLRLQSAEAFWPVK